MTIRLESSQNKRSERFVLPSWIFPVTQTTVRASMLVTAREYRITIYKYTNPAIGILDFCKQKLTAPLKKCLTKVSEHLNENKEITKPVQTLKSPSPYGRGLIKEIKVIAGHSCVTGQLGVLLKHTGDETSKKLGPEVTQKIRDIQEQADRVSNLATPYIKQSQPSYYQRM